MNIKLLCLSLLLFFALHYFLYCDYQLPITLNKLELKGNVHSVLEKETTVAGSKDNLMRKQVVSEALYEIISLDKVIIKYHSQAGVMSNYLYTKNYLPEVINRTFINNQKIASKTVFRYNNAGKVNAELLYSANGKLKDSIAVSYNEDNNAVIRNYYDANKSQYKIEEKWYNSNQKEIKNIQQVGKVNTRIIYQYDDLEKNLIEERWYLDKKIVQKVYYSYKNGFLTNKVDKNEQGDTTAITYYEYDTKTGLLTSAKTGETTTTFEYDFDANNNWIVKYEFYDKYPVKIIEREIRY